jgi:hypothetical protein
VALLLDEAAHGLLLFQAKGRLDQAAERLGAGGPVPQSGRRPSRRVPGGDAEAGREAGIDMGAGEVLVETGDRIGEGIEQASVHRAGQGGTGRK